MARHADPPTRVHYIIYLLDSLRTYLMRLEASCRNCFLAELRVSSLPWTRRGQRPFVTLARTFSNLVYLSLLWGAQHPLLLVV